jgi:hypothetical protein
MTMTDPISAAARATAQRLVPEHGPRLSADVEAALRARGTDQRPGQYVDPVSLGSLIVNHPGFVETPNRPEDGVMPAPRKYPKAA